jgi:hypothetical protein
MMHVDFTSLTELFTKLAIDLASLFAVIGLIYFPRMKDKDYVFTFFVFNLLIFLVCYFMNSMQLTMGLGFGLFALFGILRYRTILVPIKEMTYLFTVIVLAIINSLGTKEVGMTEVVAANFIIVALIFFLEKLWLRTQTGYKVITYEKIELIKPENRVTLMNDLRQRTGLNITRLEIDSINFMNDTCVIKVFFDIEYYEGIRRVVEKGEVSTAPKMELSATS